MTSKEKYGHDDMSEEELEQRIAADLFELADRLRKDPLTKPIGQLMYSCMGTVREAFRTAQKILAVPR